MVIGLEKLITAMGAPSDTCVLLITPYFGVSHDKYATLSPVVKGPYDGCADGGGKTEASLNASDTEEPFLLVECEELGGCMIHVTGDFCVFWFIFVLGLD